MCFCTLSRAHKSKRTTCDYNSFAPKVTFPCFHRPKAEILGVNERRPILPSPRLHLWNGGHNRTQEKAGIFRRDYSNGNLLSVSLCATRSRSVSLRACGLFESTCLNLSSAKINNCQVSGCGLGSQPFNSATAVKGRLTNIINTKLWLCDAPPLLFMRK